MTTYYKAIFSDGTVLKRSTASRKYSHAYLSRGTYESHRFGLPHARWRHSGFSSSEAQARKNMDAETAWTRRVDNPCVIIAEVVPVVETDAREYLAT